MTTSAFDPRKDVLDRLAFSLQLFGSDLRSMSDDDLAACCGGASRCGFDFVYEMVGFFDTFAGLLTDGPSQIEGPQGGWVRAPKDFCLKAPALEALRIHAEKFTAAVQNYQGDFVADVFPSPVGPFTPLGMANLAVWHTMYHSGQLNYIQTVRGDVDFHWLPEAD
ncbi:MAG: hypothetical protein JST30_12555 [Armatimonadetes bacterium]|nr:hypothetical protein [Armatimonadota bacterium]